MRGYRAIDVVQMLLVFGIHGYGCAQIVAFGAGADFDVLLGGVGRVLLDGFEDFAGEIGVGCAHDFEVKVGGEGDKGFLFGHGENLSKRVAMGFMVFNLARCAAVYPLALHKFAWLNQRFRCLLNTQIKDLDKGARLRLGG